VAKTNKTINALYMLAVLVFAGAFIALTGSRVTRATTRATQAHPDRRGAAGTARDVDMEKLERLLLHGYLSDHEAKYYEKSRDDRPPDVRKESGGKTDLDEEQREDKEHGHD
jgi:hypothetical protein